MDLVDAITQWVDHIDEELAEDDRAAITRVQRAIDAGAWGQIDIDEIDAPSASSIKKSLVGVDADEFVAWIIDGTVSEFGPPQTPKRAAKKSADADPPNERARAKRGKKSPDTAKKPASTSKDSAGAFGVALTEPEPLEPAAKEPLKPAGSGIFAAAATADLADEPALTEEALTSGFAAAWLDSDTALAPTERTVQADAFFADLERSTTASVTGPAAVELRSGDVLGPTFLPDARPKPWLRAGVLAIAAVAVAAFVFAGWQLISQVDEAEPDADIELADDGDAAESTSDAAEVNDPAEQAESNAAETRASDASNAPSTAQTETSETDPETDPDAVEAGGGSDGDPAITEAATPEPQLPLAETVAVILTEAGDVFAVDLLAGEFGEPRSLYSSTADVPATSISEVDEGVAVVTDDGDVLLLDLLQAGLRTKLWDSDDEIGARDAADVGDRYAILDRTGSIVVFDKDPRSRDDEPTLIWDTAVGGTPPVGSMGGFKHLLAFSLQNGDVQMLVTADDRPDQLLQLWNAEAQPRASNIEINAHGVHMGVGGGAIARYNLLDYEGPPLIAMWDPLDGSKLPAINYAGAGERAAVVLNNGSVALTSPDNEPAPMWDAEVSDLRAIDVAATDDEVVLILDGGTVLRVSLAGESEALGSIWDVTDESVSPAVKVLLIEN